MRLHTLLTVLCTLPLATSCSLDIGSDTWNASSATQGCPRWKCGSNSAVVNGMEVGELNLAGQAGDGGFRILSVTDVLGLPLTLDVENGMFKGKPLLLPWRTGAAMNGTRIILENLADLSLHAIVIDDFDYIPSWTDPGFSVPAYHLFSAHVDVLSLDILPPYDDVCGSTLYAQGLGLFSENYAVLVNGERYDPYTKTVTATGAAGDGWFNIACNGTALAKMKLMGYDPELTDTAATQATTTAERAATLKMITGAYCPSGVSFTVSGQPLRWYNRDGTVEPAADAPAEASLEAIWTDTGALCLDVPRRASAEPDIMDAIVAECGAPLPSCDAFADNWQAHGEWRTANPVEP